MIFGNSLGGNFERSLSRIDLAKKRPQGIRRDKDVTPFEVTSQGGNLPLLSANQSHVPVD